MSRHNTRRWSLRRALCRCTPTAHTDERGKRGGAATAAATAAAVAAPPLPECRLRRARQARGKAWRRGEARRRWRAGEAERRRRRRQRARGARGGGAEGRRGDRGGRHVLARGAGLGGGRGWLFSAHRLRARALVQLQAGPSARSLVRGRSTPWSHLRGTARAVVPFDGAGHRGREPLAHGSHRGAGAAAAGRGARGGG